MWKEHIKKIKQQEPLIFDELSTLYNKEEIDPYDSDDAIAKWLSQRLLLVNIPFQYLIPSPNMLPENTIRFFHINPNWLMALIDGAYSLGRTSSMDLTHDKAMINDLFDRANKSSQSIRPLLQSKKIHSVDLSKQIEHYGGFLLRSPLVRGWRGLEFIAKSSDENQNDKVITALRIETIADDVLIGIYEEMPSKLEIAQPPEGMHFGINLGKDHNEKAMRNFEDGKIFMPQKMIVVPMKNNTYRTIDVVATATNIEKCFEFDKKSQKITSAEFALQMIKSPYKAEISIITEKENEVLFNE